MTFLPKDLTPAQRAALKLASHFLLIFVFNALLAGYVWVSNGAVFSWREVFLVVGAQAALAVLDAGKKYFTAQGDIPFSSLLELARLQLAQRAPQVAYTPAQQTFQQGINTIFAPDPVSAPAQLSITSLPTSVDPVSVAAAAHPLATPVVVPAAPVADDPANQITAPRPVVTPAQ